MAKSGKGTCRNNNYTCLESKRSKMRKREEEREFIQSDD